jgi:hypothetical protein
MVLAEALTVAVVLALAIALAAKPHIGKLARAAVVPAVVPALLPCRASLYSHQHLPP